MCWCKFRIKENKPTVISFCGDCLSTNLYSITTYKISFSFSSKLKVERKIVNNLKFSFICTSCGSKNIIYIRIEDKYIYVYFKGLIKSVIKNKLKHKNITLLELINELYDNISKFINFNSVIKSFKSEFKNLSYNDMHDVLNFLKENSDKELFKVLLVEIIGGDINE